MIPCQPSIRTMGSVREPTCWLRAKKIAWKDDLKRRVKSAMSEASDKEDFLKKLKEHGINGKPQETKTDRNKGGKYRA